MAIIEITDQDKALLNLIAKGEAVRGADPYTSVFPNTSEPSLIQMTLAEVLRFQRQRVQRGFRSSACGRYQFIRTTLEECIGYLGVDPLTTRFSPGVQDALIIARLERVRGYSQWKGKALPTDRFMIRLAQEFASIPVPYNMQGATRQLVKGQSYYAGDNLNRAHHDADTFYANLVDILEGGPGTASQVDTSIPGVNSAIPANGTSPKSRTQSAAGGIGVGQVIGGNAGAQRPLSSELPAASNVYRYRTTDPLDDRYDFRTGEKVRDLLVNGTSAAALTNKVSSHIGQSNVEVTNIGSVPAPIESRDLDIPSPTDSKLMDNILENKIPQQPQQPTVITKPSPLTGSS